jgi:hypothetical protein
MYFYSHTLLRCISLLNHSAELTWDQMNFSCGARSGKHYRKHCHGRWYGVKHFQRSEFMVGLHNSSGWDWKLKGVEKLKRKSSKDVEPFAGTAKVFHLLQEAIWKAMNCRGSKIWEVIASCTYWEKRAFLSWHFTVTFASLS